MACPWVFSRIRLLLLPSSTVLSKYDHFRLQKTKMATSTMPDSRFQDSSPQTNGSRHSGCVHFYYSLWQQQRHDPSRLSSHCVCWWMTNLDVLLLLGTKVRNLPTCHTCSWLLILYSQNNTYPVYADNTHVYLSHQDISVTSAFNKSMIRHRTPWASPQLEQTFQIKQWRLLRKAS